MNGRGQHKAGQGGDGGATERKTLPPWPSPTLCPRSLPAGGGLTIAGKTTAAAAQRTPGWFFFNTAADGSA